LSLSLSLSLSRSLILVQETPIRKHPGVGQGCSCCFVAEMSPRLRSDWILSSKAWHLSLLLTNAIGDRNYCSPNWVSILGLEKDDLCIKTTEKYLFPPLLPLWLSKQLDRMEFVCYSRECEHYCWVMFIGYKEFWVHGAQTRGK
jgi:hypothetical protein